MWKTTQKLLQGMGARVLTDNISKLEVLGGTMNTPAPLADWYGRSRLDFGAGPAAGAFRRGFRSACQAAVPSVRRSPSISVWEAWKRWGGNAFIEPGYVGARGNSSVARVAMDVFTVGGTRKNLLMAAAVRAGKRVATVFGNCAIRRRWSICRNAWI